MCNKKIGIIRENFEKYFDADWLESIIKNYGYDGKIRILQTFLSSIKPILKR